MSHNVAPRGLADRCRERAALDGVDTMTALLLWVSAVVIDRQADEVVRLARLLERLEAQHDA